MTDRLSALDASFLHLEERSRGLHLGSVMIFDAPPEGLDVTAFLAHVKARIALVPRYRCRIRSVPAKLASPVWVDDEHFDLSYHVRRSAVPRPGSTAQLNELIARIMPRPLDRRRPLWELYIVEGLENGQVALFTKTHPAMIDGVRAVALGHVLLDDEPRHNNAPADTWQPSREPTRAELIAGAVMDNLRTPSQVVGTLRAEWHRIGISGAVSNALTAARTAARIAPPSPLHVPQSSDHRRFATTSTDVAVLRDIRDHYAAGAWRRAADVTVLGADAEPRITINDVVLAVLAGALRNWLLSRSWAVTPTSVIRTLLPLSVHLTAEDEGTQLSTAMDAGVVDLPVGEASAAMRLHRIAFQLAPHGDSDRAVPARSLMGLHGFAPPTIHALGVRAAKEWSSRLFHLIVTNVPGPQHPLYARRLRMAETYPVVPLMDHQALAVGVTSYQRQVFFGLNADRDAMPDLDDFVDCMHESLEELKGTVS